MIFWIAQVKYKSAILKMIEILMYNFIYLFDWQSKGQEFEPPILHQGNAGNLK